MRTVITCVVLAAFLFAHERPEKLLALVAGFICIGILLVLVTQRRWAWESVPAWYRCRHRRARTARPRSPRQVA